MIAVLRHFKQTHGARFFRYASVSAVGVVLGQSLLLVFHSVLDWPAGWSNVLSVTLATIPAYLLNRAWVWGRNGSHNLRTEVLPFWGMAFLGLLLSTVAAKLAAEHLDAKIWVNIANLAAFGVLWVAKYFIIDQYMFAPAVIDDRVPAESPA